MQRLARAHANCVEGFPIFGGLLSVALVTDSLAPWLMLALLDGRLPIAYSEWEFGSAAMLALTSLFVSQFPFFGKMPHAKSISVLTLLSNCSPGFFDRMRRSYASSDG